MTAWRRFLDSPAGTALRQRMRSVESDLALRSCQDVMHTAHSAGRAAGFADAGNWLESLSRVSCEVETQIPIEIRQDDVSLDERYSP